MKVILDDGDELEVNSLSELFNELELDQDDCTDIGKAIADMNEEGIAEIFNGFSSKLGKLGPEDYASKTQWIYDNLSEDAKCEFFSLLENKENE